MGIVRDGLGFSGIVPVSLPSNWYHVAHRHGQATSQLLSAWPPTTAHRLHADPLVTTVPTP